MLLDLFTAERGCSKSDSGTIELKGSVTRNL
jgi:hypothetical protein